MHVYKFFGIDLGNDLVVTGPKLSGFRESQSKIMTSGLSNTYTILPLVCLDGNALSFVSFPCLLLTVTAAIFRRLLSRIGDGR